MVWREEEGGGVKEGREREEEGREREEEKNHRIKNEEEKWKPRD